MQQFQAPSPLSVTSNPAENWNRWEQSFRRYIATLGEKDEQVKIDILLHTIGEDAPEVYNTLTVRPEGDQLTMEDVLQAFKYHCRAQKNVVFERYQYWSYQITAETSVNRIITELRQRCKYCEFGVSENDMLRDKLVLSITDSNLKKRLIQEGGLTLHRAIEICRATEQEEKTEHGVQEVPGDGELNMILPDKSLHHNTSGQSGSQSIPNTDQKEKLVLAAFTPIVQLHRLQLLQPSVTVCFFSERKNVEQLLPERLHIKQELEMLSEEQEENQLCVQQETNNAVCTIKYVEEKPQSSQLHWRQITEINIKEEPEILTEKQEENQLCVQQETNSAVCPVKYEYEEKKPQASHLHWRQLTEINFKEEPSSCTLDELMKRKIVGTNRKGPEAAENPHPSSLVLKGPDGTETDSPNNRVNHMQNMRIHTGEKPFKCDVCGTCFKNMVNLRRHMRIHTGVKPFECDVCRKCFIDNSQLKRHMKIHTGEKPFQCVVCSDWFTRKVNLKVHMRIHTGERPFKCDFCSKGFIRKADLQSHVKNHTGEKSFKCDDCRRCFKRSGDLKKHRRIHSKDKLLKTH